MKRRRLYGHLSTRKSDQLAEYFEFKAAVLLLGALLLFIPYVLFGQAGLAIGMVLCGILIALVIISVLIQAIRIIVRNLF